MIRNRFQILTNPSVVTRYLYGLQLQPQALLDKRFVDCGCENGSFVEYCLDNGITESAYGIDLEIPKPTSIKNQTHFVQGNFLELLPWNDLDYIFFVRVLFNDYFNEQEFLELIEKLTTKLKPTGEIRIFPIDIIAENATDRELYPKLLKTLKASHLIYKFIPIEMDLSPNGPRRTEKLLVIQPKKR